MLLLVLIGDFHFAQLEIFHIGQNLCYTSVWLTSSCILLLSYYLKTFHDHISNNRTVQFDKPVPSYSLSQTRPIYRGQMTYHQHRY